jgi:superfamily II DNA or RNA helicase
MECGLDIPEVHIVLVIKPFGRLHDLIQAFGRAGRFSSEGLKRALCYTLWEGKSKMDGVITLPFF